MLGLTLFSQHHWDSRQEADLAAETEAGSLVGAGKSGR